jgi:hypothetical protein
MGGKGEEASHDFRDFGAMEEAGGAWDIGIEFDDAEPGAEGEEGMGSWGDDDFDIPDVGAPAAPSAEPAAQTATTGVPQTQKWARATKIPGELVACGAF